MGVLAGLLSRICAAPAAALERQRGHLFAWAPVALALGIGLYFLWSVEPGGPVYAAAAGLGLAGAAFGWRRRDGAAALGWALALAAAGFGLAGGRAHLLAAPVLAARYYGPVEGRVVALDRSATDALRLTLDQLRLADLPPGQTPARVRIALHGQAAAGPVPRPGARIMTTANLAPPQGPVEPGGFDFRRHAWFLRLGAVGYTRAPVLGVAPPAGSRLAALRMALSGRMRAALSGDPGGFAAAVTTGDRSGVSRATLEDLRASNLAHLLAISGLHMGLLTGFVFGLLRLALALLPPLALRWPARKLAAGGAILVAAGYLALSGGNVATERAFVMTAVILGALLVDRRALSLRAVALAALIVLAMRPESLLGPGFQMSFAATTALIAVFGSLRDLGIGLGPRWLAPVAGVALSSLVAGLATAPVAAAHFNTLAHFGLPANLLAVPVMGLVVIPAAVLAACLAPFGLEDWGLQPMGLGLRWILGVAHWAAGLPGARGYVVSPGPAVLPLFALGALVMILWQGRARLAGLLPLAAAFALWAGAERPQILVAEGGGLVGVMTGQGRALSKPRGDGFVAQIWLENDGDGSDQAAAAARWPDPGPATEATTGMATGAGAKLRVIRAGALRVVHVWGRAAPDLDRCAKDEVIVSAVPLTLSGPCLLLDPPHLRGLGAVAIGDKGLRVTGDGRRRRLWSGPPPRPKPP